MPMARPVRGVWVARFHYRTPEDVRTIMRNCAELGCNTVFWQVRGAGTVAYPSRIEPWSAEFNYRDPGFDPLALAVQEAHRHGLRIEAWVNVLPGWRGRKPPPMRDQLWNAHPDWFLHDATGQPQPLGDFYVIVNPCLPEVRRHIVSVVDEIATRYAVDGIHLDYVRYAWDTTPNAAQKYPRDARTLALYRRETGKSPDDDANAWRHWRANQLTRLVQDIRDQLARRRPGATLTAAVMANPDSAYYGFFQNGVTWLRSGLVDALMPMAYADRLNQFVADVGAYRQLASGRRIVPGVGIYKHQTREAMRQQLERCRQWGGDFALFSYDSLQGNSAGQEPQRMRREVLGEFPGR
ncbi:MAG: family 10 glycosylhydrolase [Planctomycetota bacterium]